MGFDDIIKIAGIVGALFGNAMALLVVVSHFTPTSRDNDALAKINRYAAMCIRIVMALADAAHIDPMKGRALDIPPDPPLDLPDRPDMPRPELGTAAHTRARLGEINRAAIERKR